MKRLSFILLLLITHVVPAEIIEITDSNGKIKFREIPKRVVVLNWTLAEQLLSLGIHPVGMADTEGYQNRIIKPVLPDDVVDVGSRMAPKIALIKSLKPDLIVVGYSQRPLIRTLSNITTVVYFKNFSRRYHNAEKADERLLELAKLFNKNQQAQNIIDAREKSLAVMADSLVQKWPNNSAPKINVLVIDNETDAWLFSQNSMPHYALRALGLELAVVKQPTEFGVHKIAVSELSSVDGCFLYVSFTGFDPLMSTSWQKTQAAEQSCLLPMSMTSLYGGAQSLLYLAENMVKALKHYPSQILNQP